MNFWAWLLKAPSEADDWKSSDLLKKEKGDLLKQIEVLEKEVCHWKAMALNFRKFHQ